MYNTKNRISPDIHERIRAIQKYSQRKPALKWGPHDNDGVVGSGWNPLRGVNVAFSDESATKDMMWFVIELPAPGMSMSGLSLLALPCLPLMYKHMMANAVAVGYFFSRDRHTGKVDFLYRLKPFKGPYIYTYYHMRIAPLEILTPFLLSVIHLFFFPPRSRENCFIQRLQLFRPRDRDDLRNK
jgi:hypothetical protein